MDGRFHQAIGKSLQKRNLNNDELNQLEGASQANDATNRNQSLDKQTCTRIPVVKYTTSTVSAQALRPKYIHAKYSTVNGTIVQLPLLRGRRASGRESSCPNKSAQRIAGIEIRRLFIKPAITFAGDHVAIIIIRSERGP